MKNLIAVIFMALFLSACGGSGKPVPVEVLDTDGDGVVDTQDAFPFDQSESVDTDSDGVGNNADQDDDNDGVVDSEDPFPLDQSESVDTDGDGIGNNADTDDDNDGVADVDDLFPLDQSESLDTDGDGIGNNADQDDDNDGIADSEDAFPLDPTESVDTDGDGIGNNADEDDDGDGVLDSEDAFPLDQSESVDTDGDGTGNNADEDDDNDTVADTEDAFPLDIMCWLPEHADSSGENCDQSATMSIVDLTSGTEDGNDNLLVIHVADKRIYRWSAVSKTYIEPLVLSLDALSADVLSADLIYSPTDDRIYVGYSNGLVSYFDVTQNVHEQQLFQSNVDINRLVSAGQFIVAESFIQDGGYVIRTYDFNGVLSGELLVDHSLQYSAWNEHTNELYVHGGGALDILNIDHSSGSITKVEVGQSINSSNQLSLTTDGQYLVLGNDIYKTADWSVHAVLDGRFNPTGAIGSQLLTFETLYDGYGGPIGSTVSIWDLENMRVVLTQRVMNFGIPWVVVNDDLLINESGSSSPVGYLYIVVGGHDGDGL